MRFGPIFFESHTLGERAATRRIATPDGSRVDVTDRNDLWSWDFSQLTLTRLTFDPAEAPDSRRLIVIVQNLGEELNRLVPTN